MDLHPIFVHFPVALLTVYSLLELVRFRAVLNKQYWFYLKASFVIIGALTIPFALVTGDEAGDSIPSSMHAILEAHEAAAFTTAWVFGIIAIGYLLAWLQKEGVRIAKNEILTRITGFLQYPVVLVILAIVGLVSITVTGALGGALAYGCDVEPLVTLLCAVIG